MSQKFIVTLSGGLQQEDLGDLQNLRSGNGNNKKLLTSLGNKRMEQGFMRAEKYTLKKRRDMNESFRGVCDSLYRGFYSK